MQSERQHVSNIVITGLVARGIERTNRTPEASRWAIDSHSRETEIPSTLTQALVHRFRRVAATILSRVATMTIDGFVVCSWDVFPDLLLSSDLHVDQYKRVADSGDSDADEGDKVSQASRGPAHQPIGPHQNRGPATMNHSGVADVFRTPLPQLSPRRRGQQIASAVTHWWKRARQAAKYRRSVLCLEAMDDRTLKDMGVHRSDIYSFVHGEFDQTRSDATLADHAGRHSPTDD
jgi:uncharacterized protein YjiS (DUF1127 family)